jgi:hypothetical protein
MKLRISKSMAIRGILMACGVVSCMSNPLIGIPVVLVSMVEVVNE